jgi:signal transduction histidine kinase
MYRALMKICFSITLLLVISNSIKANKITYLDDNVTVSIGSSLEVLEDKTGVLELKDVLGLEFTSLNSKVPNLGITESSFWLKFTVTNKTRTSNLKIELSLPTLDKVNFYYFSNNRWNVIKSGEDFVFHERVYNDPNYIFDCEVPESKARTFFLKVSSSEGIQLPIILGSTKAIYEHQKNRDLLSGIYLGLMFVIIIYNLFIYFSVRDRSYIFYVVYVLLILLTQTSVQGYPFQYLWPGYPVLAKYGLFIFPSLVGMASLLFMNEFLKVKETLPVFYKISYYLFIPYFISIGLSLFNFFKFSFILMEINAGIVSVFMLITVVIIVRKGYEPAKYFLMAWIIFLLGVIIYILKDLGVLPFNNFTRYTMQIGSAIETVLLSFALAAKINIYKKERLEALQEKQKIIKEQNITLEQNVEKRTRELNQTLIDLKNTQTQLVEAEKMSSLGQLTAGIAHEINNPINFVSSNIHPLRQDINDLKQLIAKYGELEVTEDIKGQLEEIQKLKEELDYDYLKEELDSIVDGIEEGASRTAEIVNGLRTFSRLDESTLKDVDINEGIESTLLLVKSKLNQIKLIKHLGDLPLVECNPGKMNQVFMNLVVNAIFAVHQKKYTGEEEGLVSVTTERVENEKIKIIIEDNGVGIPNEIKNKLFDPFFTTKSVGEGTGLGLSIVKSIIESHNGEIKIDSELNKGTKIIIVLPQKKINE